MRYSLQRAFSSSYSITLVDPAITPESFSIAIAFLYTPSILKYVNSSSCAGVLAAAYYLGLESLASYAAEGCSKAVRGVEGGEDVAGWFKFLGGGSGRLDEGYGRGALDGGHSNGSNGVGGAGGEGEDKYGAHGRRLRRELLTRVTTTLASELGAGGNGAGVGGQKALIDVLAALPFAAFQAVLESSRFPMQEEMDRCESRPLPFH